MVNRRHIRIKVMQSVYAMLHAESDDLVKEEKFLRFSISKMLDFYSLQLLLMLEVKKIAEEVLVISKKKFLATKEDIQPNLKFVNNAIFKAFEENASFMDYVEKHNISDWDLEIEYPKLLWKALKDSDLYAKYMANEETTFKEDKQFVLDFYTEIIAPNDKLASYYEDKMISWADDLPYINTWILRDISAIKEGRNFKFGKIYKDDDDFEYVSKLFRKTILHHHEFEEDIKEKTPNWEVERIADMDLILIKMAIAEFLYFPSIPVKVTINEFIEISKDYSTKNSSVFINGVLDKLSKKMQETKRIKKIGRGLL